MIPTYLQADVVGRAIESALQQDYPNLEVIVSDDASPDDTRTAVARFRDARLNYHRNTVNLGRVANYRKCLYERAHGDWVVNLDGDDEFTDPGFISAAMHASQSAAAPVVLVVGQIATYVDGRRIKTPSPPAGLYDGRELTMLSAEPAYHLKHMGCVYRRDRALQLGFYRVDAISSDWESLYRLACQGNVVVLDRVVGRWNQGPRSASNVPSAAVTIENLAIWDSIEEELCRSGVNSLRAERAMAATRRSLARGDLVRLTQHGRIREIWRVVSRAPIGSVSNRVRLVLSWRLVAHAILALTGVRRHH